MIPDRNSLREKRCVALKAWRSSWGHGNGSVRQDAVHILVEQEAEFGEPGLGKAFQGLSLLTYFFQLGPISERFPRLSK